MPAGDFDMKKGRVMEENQGISGGRDKIFGSEKGGG